MKWTVVTAAASALLLLGCLKPQPVMVAAPVVINIPPMPKTAEVADLPAPSCGPRLIYIAPQGWDEESRQKESVTLRRHDNADAVIAARVEDAVSGDAIDAAAEEFHQGIKEDLARVGIVAASYVSIMRVIPPGDSYESVRRDEFVIVRYSSEMGCGTAAFARPHGPPKRFLVFRGDWPCDSDVENDAVLQNFMQNARILTE